MFWYYLLRWTLFLVVGIPFQLLCYALWPFFVTYFWFFVRGKAGVPITPPAPRFTTDQQINGGKADATRDTYYLNIGDDDAALIHMYFWMLRPELSEGGLHGLIDQSSGCVLRINTGGDQLPVSGDSLSSWVAAYVGTGGNKEDLRKLAWHYFKNCMGLGVWCQNWQVSNRSSNSGINYVYDGWHGINQPALGPQYYTSAALLRLAARDLGGLWWFVYFAHYWLMGGWLWWTSPTAYIKGNTLYYVQQVTLMNLYSLASMAKNPISKLMYRWAIRYICIHIADQGNCDPIFYGFAAKVGALSQTEIDRALQNIVCIKPEWPQDEPDSPSYYDPSNDSPVFSVAGATAQALLEAKKK